MAEEHQKTSCGCESSPAPPATNVETTDRGMFDFLGKKEAEKPQAQQEEEVIVTEFEKVKVSEHPEEHKEEEEKLHGSSSSFSISSSDEEEVEEGGEKKKIKKKGLKEKIKEKMEDKKEEEKKEERHEDTSVPIEKSECFSEAPPHNEAEHPEEKKGLLEKIKEKLPGHHKKPEEAMSPATPVPSPCAPEHAGEVNAHEEGEAKEKKGIFEKIKEKLPGYGHKNGEEKKEEHTGGYTD